MSFVVFVIIILLSVLDNSIATLIISTGMYVIGAVFVVLYQRENLKKNFLFYNIVFSVYFTLAFIVSSSFSVRDFFLVSDPSRYIESFINSTGVSWGREDIVSCYLDYTDSNALYNAYLDNVAVFVNKSLGGITVYGLTICNTIWGVLSSVVLFRILTRRLDLNRAFRFSLVFAFCSLFLFYSTVIIRDIIICFLYLVAFDIVDQKFKLSGVIKLLLLIFLTWGIRLYSGLFLIVFFGYYFYKVLYNSALRPVATFVFAILLVSMSGFILASDIVSQTMDEMQLYTEFASEQSAGGMVSKLQSLPPGISHLSIALFMMIGPLPPLNSYIGVQTFSHFVMSTMRIVAAFFWFVLFYSLFYKLFIKKYIAKLPFDRIVLLLVCLVFIFANTSHPDVRRMLPVFPIIFVQYTEICKIENKTLFGSEVSKNLMAFYVIIAIGLLLII